MGTIQVEFFIAAPLRKHLTILVRDGMLIKFSVISIMNVILF